MKKNLRNNLLLLCVILLLISLMLESILLFIHNDFKKQIRKAGNVDQCIEAHPELIYTFKPNVCGTNSMGFYDYEYEKEKPDGVTRIIVIGDSVAQGQGLNFTDSFPKVLERKLGEEYEVINFARSGYSLSQEMILLEEALQWEPDLIIWSYVLNDPAHPVYLDANGHLGKYFYNPPSHLLDFIKMKLYLLKGYMQGKKCGVDFHQMIHCAYWDETEANIMKIGQSEVPVLFTIHPVFVNNKTYPYMNIHEKLNQTATLAGMKVVDLRRAYENYDLEDVRYATDDPWHPSKLGQKLIANYLYEIIVYNKTKVQTSYLSISNISSNKSFSNRQVLT